MAFKNQVKVKISFKNGSAICTWFNEFSVHRNEEDNQIVEGITHQTAEVSEEIAFMRIADITFIQVLEVRQVEVADPVEEEVAQAE